MHFCGGTVSLHKETCAPISDLLDCNSTVGSRGQRLLLLQALRVHHRAGSACQEKHWCAANTGDVQTGFSGETGEAKRSLV